MPTLFVVAHRRGKWTRRDFLKAGFLAAPVVVAGAGAGYLVGRPNRLPELRVAIVGCRGHGTKLARSFMRQEGVGIATVCDPDSEVCDKLAKLVERRSHLTVAQVADLRSVLDDDSIDAVVIATPHHWHAVATVWALQAGKHVYLEKPMTHSLAEGEPLLRAAARYGRVIQIGAQLRSQPNLIEAIDFMNAGGIGRVDLARCYSWKRRKPIGPTGSYQAPVTVDEGLWFGPRPIEPLGRPNFHYDWHWDWRYGNGGLGNNGVHRIDVALWGLGLKTFPDWAMSYGGRMGLPDAGETPNTQIAIFQWETKTIVHELRGLPTGPPAEFEKGDGIVFHGTEGKLVYGSSHATLYDRSGGFEREFRIIGPRNTTDRHVANFIEAITSGNPTSVRAHPSDGYVSASLCHLGSISHRTGRRASVAEIGQVLASLETADDLAGTLDRTRRHLVKQEAMSDLTLGSQLILDGESIVDNPEAAELAFDSYRTPYVLPAPSQV